MRSKDNKVVPLKEKDLIEKKNGEEKPGQKTTDINAKALEEEDFQLYMGVQMLKSWDALRGKNP